MAASGISVAIVGAGRTGGWHVRDLSAIDGVRVSGVADTRIEMARELASAVGAPAFDDYRAMLDEVKPDVLYICTPASEHADQVAWAAEHAIDVFVEKPLAMTVSDGHRAVEAVERSGILCAVGYQMRSDPATDAARAALEHMPIALLAGWWYWTVPLVGWIRDRHWGGGQVFDQGTHLIDLMRALAGEVTEVHAAYTRNAIDEQILPNWDACALTLRFASGAVGSLHTTYALFPGLPDDHGLDVVTREMLVRIGFGRSTVFRPNVDPVETRSAGWNIDQSLVPIFRERDAAAIRSTARDALLTLAVTRAANYSAAIGRPVQLDDFLANPPEDDHIMPTARPPFPLPGEAVTS